MPSAAPSAKARAQDNVIRTKILLLGMRRSGKTSIRQVLFNDLSPRETLYLETTTHLTKHPFDTVIPLEIWDCPGDTSPDTLDAPLSQFATMIFVIDIQDLYHQPIQKLVNFVIAAYQENPNMNLEVFVHKADVLTEEYKIENFRHIQERVLYELGFVNAEYEQIPINFQLTSIYDHSLHDAFSRVLHKLIDSLPYLEDLLNVFCSNSQATKAFLFDTESRLYVATDASPVDPPTHNLCSDYLQTLNAFGPLYKSISASPLRMQASTPDPPVPPTPAGPSAPASPRPPTATAPPSAAGSTLASPASPSAPLSSAQSPHPDSALLPALAPAPTTTSTTASPSPLAPPALPTASTSGPTSTPTLAPAPTSTSTPSPSPAPLPTPTPTPTPPAPRPRFYPSAAASLSLSPSPSPSAATAAGTTLTYYLVAPRLALLALVPAGVFAARRGLVEYNVVFFREGVQEICAVEAEARRMR
ncbi:Gtr1/RagA G protein conserved region-domain-containing protein [Trametes maxima]|nr:Gtr1/RagA G protein conserved region-domain-containing protein [Trametes maxima]